MFGLKNKDIEDITNVLRNFPEVEQAIIFGSRAKGNYKNGSDVDIAIKGEKASYKIALQISGILNEDTVMPYRFDVLNYGDLKNKELTAHINRVGKRLYARGNKI
ncbi:MAG: nucleotidyltransferase domain-containing protein [Mangrovibacterium sp.]|nr:nucleotidyltransferase domain-containing protein [Mangrovibacterium sp.]